jgi:hypothetical protein
MVCFSEDLGNKPEPPFKDGWPAAQAALRFADHSLARRILYTDDIRRPRKDFDHLSSLGPGNLLGHGSHDDFLYLHRPLHCRPWVGLHACPALQAGSSTLAAR